MKGRKPTPTQLKLVRGVRKSRINKKEPRPPISLLKPPDYLTDLEKKIWYFHAKEAHEFGIVTTLDVFTFETMVVNWARALRCKKEIDKPAGLVFKGPKGGPVWNPYVSMERKFREQALKAAAELGFTPSSRSRVSVNVPEAEEDPFAVYEGGEK